VFARMTFEDVDEGSVFVDESLSFARCLIIHG
jgi:hypothetical protein